MKISPFFYIQEKQSQHFQKFSISRNLLKIKEIKVSLIPWYKSSKWNTSLCDQRIFCSGMCWQTSFPGLTSHCGEACGPIWNPAQVRCWQPHCCKTIITLALQRGGHCPLNGQTGCPGVWCHLIWAALCICGDWDKSLLQMWPSFSFLQINPSFLLSVNSFMIKASQKVDCDAKQWADTVNEYMCVAVLSHWMWQRSECYEISPRLPPRPLSPVSFQPMGRQTLILFTFAFSYGNCWTVCAPLVDLLPGLWEGGWVAMGQSGTKTSVNKWIGSLQINLLK